MLYCIKEKGYENLCSLHFAVKASHINVLIFLYHGYLFLVQTMLL